MKKHVRFLTVGLGMLLLVGAGCSSSDDRASTPDRSQGQTTGTSPKGDDARPPENGAMRLKPQSPPALTDAQKAELAAGTVAHAPKSLTFNISSGMFFYVPNEIHVKKGDRVTFIVTNMGGHHNFTLDEFNIKTEANDGGTTSTVQFVAEKTGTFEYYCNIGKHRQMGQKGQLIVE